MLGLFKKTAQSYSDDPHKNIRSAQQNIDIVRSEVYNISWVDVEIYEDYANDRRIWALNINKENLGKEK